MTSTFCIPVINTKPTKTDWTHSGLVPKMGHELGMVGIVGIALLPAPNGADHNPAGPRTGTIPSHRQGEDGKQSLEKKTARWP